MTAKGIRENNSKQEEAALHHLDTLKKLRIVIRAAQRHSTWIEKQCGVSGAQLWVMHYWTASAYWTKDTACTRCRSRCS